MISNIFGGNTSMTYEDIQRKRAIAKQLSAANGKTPKNVGEGLHAIGRALASRSLSKKADARDAELRGQFNDQFGDVAPNSQGLVDLANSPYAGRGHQKIISALMKGAPNYKRGTAFHPGGQAVVGENGPELLNLPRGAQVMPTGNVFQPGNEQDDAPAAFRKMTPQQQQEFMTLTPDEKQRVLRSLEGPEPQIEYEGPRDFLNQLPDQNESSIFQPGAEYKTADLAGITPEDMGVGQRNKIQDSAFAYSSLMKGLDDFEKTFKDGGGTAWPGSRKDELATQHRNLQMQMKELYNLGVLNGPDLDLMNEILVNPTSVGSNVLDAVGISDLDERIPTNISRVRKMMTNMVEPKLKAANINIDELAPKKQLSDEEYLKSLGLE